MDRYPPDPLTKSWWPPEPAAMIILSRPASPPSGGLIELEDGSGSILLEDGSGSIALE